MIENTSRLSIGMPVYNGEAYLAEALDSLLSQTFLDFELIISDNASTDGTQAICLEYASQDRRILYDRLPENLGAAKNFNRVFEMSRGEYFKWAAHDDLCAPEYMERCIAILDESTSVVLCYSQTDVIDEHGAFIKIDPSDLNLGVVEPFQRYRNFHQVYRYPRSCNPIFGVIRSSALAQTPLIESFVSSDMVLLGELALRGEFHEIPEPLFLRRDHKMASVRAYPEYQDRIAWFDPQRKHRLQLTHWRWLWGYYDAIRRVSMEQVDRRRCYLQLVCWITWHVRGLSKDLLKALFWPAIRTYWVMRK